MGKSLTKTMLVALTLVLAACGEDEESCGEDFNSKINDICYSGFRDDYDIHNEYVDGEWGDPIGDEMVIEFRGNGGTYKLAIDPGHRYYDQTTKTWIEEFAFIEADVEYTHENSNSSLDCTNCGGGAFQVEEYSFSLILDEVVRDEAGSHVSGHFESKKTGYITGGELVTQKISGSFSEIGGVLVTK